MSRLSVCGGTVNLHRSADNRFTRQAVPAAMASLVSDPLKQGPRGAAERHAVSRRLLMS